MIISLLRVGVVVVNLNLTMLEGAAQAQADIGLEQRMLSQPELHIP